MYGFSKTKQDPKQLEFKHPVFWKVSECVCVAGDAAQLGVATMMNSNTNFTISLIMNCFTTYNDLLLLGKCCQFAHSAKKGGSALERSRLPPFCV